MHMGHQRTRNWSGMQLQPSITLMQLNQTAFSMLAFATTPHKQQMSAVQHASVAVCQNFQSDSIT